MQAAAIDLRGGVSPRSARLRGQSIIEYVLIIAVIGLVIVFAGPGVAGAIRNQFNQVTNTVDSGTDGDNFISAEEKAYREAMKTIASKEAKDWTLDEQKAAATDIAKNGTSSVVYAKAKAAMDAGTKWTVKLTNGETMTYRIIGINHDDLADGSGKAGLTFWAIYGIGMYQFNSSDTNAGGWEKSVLRQSMNSGEIWNLMPSDFQSKVKSVEKSTNNVGGGINDVSVTSTVDSLFLPSYIELVGKKNASYLSYKDADHWQWLGNEGYQYEAFDGKVSSDYHENECLKGDSYFRWERTPTPRINSSDAWAKRFYWISSDGAASGGVSGQGPAAQKAHVCPAFCF